MATARTLCPSCNGENEIEATQEYFFCTHCGKKMLTKAAFAYSEAIAQTDGESLHGADCSDENDPPKENELSNADNDCVSNKDVTAKSNDDTDASKITSEEKEDKERLSPSRSKNSKLGSTVAKAGLALIGLLLILGIVMPSAALSFCGTAHNAGSSEHPTTTSGDAAIGSTAYSIELPGYLEGYWEFADYTDGDGNACMPLGRASINNEVLEIMLIDENGESCISAEAVSAADNTYYFAANSDEYPYVSLNTSFAVGKESYTAESGWAKMILSDTPNPADAARSSLYILQRYHLWSMATDEPRGDNFDQYGLLMPDHYVGTYAATNAFISEKAGGGFRDADSVDGTLIVNKHSFFFKGTVEDTPIELSGITVDQFKYGSIQCTCFTDDEVYVHAKVHNFVGDFKDTGIMILYISQGASSSMKGPNSPYSFTIHFD